MRAVIFSGGGSRGIFHIGQLRALLNKDPELDYDLYAGVSAGALTASYLSTGPLNHTLPKLEHLWLNKILNNKSIWRHHLWYYIIFGICIILLFTICAFVSFILSAPKWLTLLFGFTALFSFYLPYYSLTRSHSIYNNQPLKELIIDAFNEKDIVKLLRFGAVSFNTGKFKVITEKDENLKEWLMASSAVPIFFRMPEINGDYWLDGGISEISLLNHVLQIKEVTEIDIILTSPLNKGSSIKYKGFPGLLLQLFRFIEIISAEITYNDIYIKHLSRAGIKIRLFYPKHNLLKTNSLTFNPEQLRYMYEEGLKEADGTIFGRECPPEHESSGNKSPD